MLTIGLMSGTSMDGIDAALIETDGIYHIREINHISLAYDNETKTLLKAAEFAARKYQGNLELAKQHFLVTTEEYLHKELCIEPDCLAKTILALSYYLDKKLQRDLSLETIIQLSTQWHLQAIHELLKKSDYSEEQIDVIGYHGQTLFHQPAKISLQIGNAAWLAEKSGIAVIHDFRSADINHGGQGAPLAPLFHQALAMRDNKIPAVIVNCGGIANVTVIKSGKESDLLGFDTGPANGLIDKYIKIQTQGREHMDEHGKYGSQGKVHEDILNLLYQKSIIINNENFFQKKPPKSLDIGDCQLIPELADLSFEDACATLEAFTADSIVNSTEFFGANIPCLWILAGGGWNNPVILHEMKKRLKLKIGNHITIITANELGWDGQALEAQIFAYLAVRSLRQLPLSLPTTTQVSKPLTGGCLEIPKKMPKEKENKLRKANRIS